jgi:hypothetical protein
VFEGVFDNTVFYESVDKRVRRQAEDSGGSGDNQEILSTVETTVEMDLQTEIEYDAKLEDKSTAEYAAKKTALFSELKPVLENAAETTDAELVEDAFDVTFSEAASSRKRRDDSDKKMKAAIAQKFLSKRTESFSTDLQSTINENVLTAVEGEVKKVTDAPGEGSLLTAGQEVKATATSEEVNPSWNSGKELKICSWIFFAVFTLGLIN